jgi:hypothetical protein
MASIGDNETPGSVGPIPVGAGRTVAAITAGSRHTCARLDDGNVRCWGYGGNGRLGLCSERNIGDDELPLSVGALALGGASGSACPRAATRPLTQYPAPQNTTSAPDARAAEAHRARALRSCLSAARRHARRELKRARRLSSSRRAHALRRRRRLFRRARRHCLKLYGRTPGRVRGLRARAASKHKVVLSFDAAGTDGSRPPAARSYLVKESVHAIRSTRTFRRARTLCRGSCRFPSMESVGARLRLGVTGLRSGRIYYFAVAARDNVSHRIGRRSRTVGVRTR